MGDGEREIHQESGFYFIHNRTWFWTHLVNSPKDWSFHVLIWISFVLGFETEIVTGIGIWIGTAIVW